MKTRIRQRCCHVKTVDSLYRKAIEGVIVAMLGPASSKERREIDAAVKAACDEARDEMMSKSIMVTWNQ